jgi:hypothetical protein
MVSATLAVAPSPAGAKQTAGLDNVPRLKHVFTIVLENEDFSASWGPASPAKYLNSLVPLNYVKPEIGKTATAKK